MTHLFISPDNEYPRHIGDIEREHPEFDGNITNLPTGWKPVTPTEPPVVTNNEVYFELEPVLVEGSYVQAWDIKALTDEEVEAIKSNPQPTLKIAP
jgi:hypothetical protein